MKLMSHDELAAALVCPRCRTGGLRAEEQAVACAACGRRYEATERGIVSFLIEEELSDTNRGEIKGNTFSADWEDAVVEKETWHPLYTKQMEWVIDLVARMLPAGEELCALGAGGGFDLKLLLRRRSFARVFASDISPSTTSLIARSLAEYDGTLGLFASAFEHCPIPKRPGAVGLVFQALHHAPDAHGALARLLDHSFDDLVIVEPCTNPPLGVLAKLDLVQRVEYTGTRPDWISMPRVATIAEERGYRVAAQTWWEIPPYILRWIRSRPALWDPCYRVFDAVSRVTRPIKFGSMAAVHLTRAA